MADRRQAFPDDAPGSFFADRTCIDCGTCHGLAGKICEGAGGHSRVRRQPRDEVLAVDFRWVLPGHGCAYRAESVAAMRRELERSLRRLRAA